MKNSERYGWAGIAVLVIVVDLTADKTMSEAFDDAMHDPVLRPFIIIGWAYLTAHLFGLVKHDPLESLVKLRNRLHKPRANMGSNAYP